QGDGPEVSPWGKRKLGDRPEVSPRRGGKAKGTDLGSVPGGEAKQRGLTLGLSPERLMGAIGDRPKVSPLCRCQRPMTILKNKHALAFRRRCHQLIQRYRPANMPTCKLFVISHQHKSAVNCCSRNYAVRKFE